MATLGSPEHSGGEHSIFSRFSNALSNAYKKLVGTFESQIKYGRTPMEMPAIPIVPMEKFVVGCSTGPYGGLCQLSPELDHPTHDRDTPVAGISNWYRPQPLADGESITLYEHKSGNTQHHGDPIADVYSVVLHPNNCVLAVADGVNWGIKPRLAARCAMHGVFDHLNSCLYASSGAPQTTQDIFHCILRSFHSGQKLIIQRGGTTTTLCVGVVVELQEQRGGSKWGLCIVSVGDSLCYLWRDEVQMTYEITSAMHMGKERNPRDCGGCLGCDLGDQPDLTNLLCFFVPIADNDVVFIVSDGVSDNFDPVILREGSAEGQTLSPVHAEPPPSLSDKKSDGIPRPPGPSNGSNSHLPVLNPEQRQALCLMKLTNTLKEKLKSIGYSLNAQHVKDAIINYTIEVTEVKRGYLERCWVELDRPDLTVAERRINERKIAQHIKFLPGKLDHASIAAYKVGKIELGIDLRSKSPTHSYMMKKAEPEFRKKSHSHGGSVFYGSAVTLHKGNRETVGMSVSEKGRGSGDNSRREMTKSRSIDVSLPRSSDTVGLEKAPLRKVATFDVGDVLVENVAEEERDWKEGVEKGKEEKGTGRRDDNGLTVGLHEADTGLKGEADGCMLVTASCPEDEVEKCLLVAIPCPDYETES